MGRGKGRRRGLGWGGGVQGRARKHGQPRAAALSVTCSNLSESVTKCQNLIMPGVRHLRSPCAKPALNLVRSGAVTEMLASGSPWTSVRHGRSLEGVWEVGCGGGLFVRWCGIEENPVRTEPTDKYRD